jgi:hypothetical protein
VSCKEGTSAGSLGCCVAGCRWASVHGGEGGERDAVRCCSVSWFGLVGLLSVRQGLRTKSEWSLTSWLAQCLSCDHIYPPLKLFALTQQSARSLSHPTAPAQSQPPASKLSAQPYPMHSLVARSMHALHPHCAHHQPPCTALHCPHLQVRVHVVRHVGGQHRAAGRVAHARQGAAAGLPVPAGVQPAQHACCVRAVLLRGSRFLLC